MPPDKKKPPAGDRRLSRDDVEFPGVDTPRNKRPQSKKQGARGLIPIGQVAAEIVADLKFRRQVLRLHRQGPRAMAELLAEIGVERSIATLIDQKLDTYVELEPETLEVTGGDGFWQPPLHEVDR